MQWLKTVALVVIMLLFGVGAALSVDQHEVALHFAIWKTPFELSIFWWLLVAFLLGLFAGLMNTFWVGTKRRLENRRLRQSLEKANSELDRLRNVTLDS